MFGAMLAPKPFGVAKEMVRVTKPGGQIVMGNCIPNDPTGVAQILKISLAYTPPPPEGFISPMTWGVESNVVKRFGQAGIPSVRIICEKDTFMFDASISPANYIGLFRNYYGPNHERLRGSQEKRQSHRFAVGANGAFP